MKKVIILKAFVILVPVVVAIYAQCYENKKQEKLEAFYKNMAQQEMPNQYSEVISKN